MDKRSIVKDKAIAFAMGVVGLYSFLRDEKEYVLSKQLLRSGTSIGANVSEALAGESRVIFYTKCQ